LPGWPLHNPASPGTPITLRMLPSHRSSLTAAGHWQTPLGGDLRGIAEGSHSVPQSFLAPKPTGACNGPVS
jgi:hypothetical protein